VTPEDIGVALDRYLGDRTMRALLQAVFQSYAVAHADSRARFTPRQYENIVGYEVRCQLEDALGGIAERATGVSASEERAPGAKWNRTQLRVGPLLLVENAVETPCALVKSAAFRQTLARTNELSLFDNSDEHAGGLLYVALLHSRSDWRDPAERQKWRHLPGSAYLAVPDPDVRVYLHEINLFDRFPDVVVASTPQEWNVEAHIQYLDRARKNWAV